MTKLEHAYTYWVRVQDQRFQKQPKDKNFDENKLTELDTFDTVSTARTDQVGRALLAGPAAPQETHCHAIRKYP